MIAIAESGSTKCEWVILNNEGEIARNFKTQGFNPDFHSTEFVASTLNNTKELSILKSDVSKVFFYGASCSSKKLNAIISNGLQKVFEKAGINAVFLNQFGICQNHTNKLQIPRILVRNLTGEEFGSFVNNLWN